METTKVCTSGSRRTAPVVMMPTTTARTTSPSTSSITAAPRMIFASRLAPSPRSLNTRAVIPTLVATRVTATNSLVVIGESGSTATHAA